MKILRFACLLIALSPLVATPAWAVPKVTVSIQPIHSLVAAVMEGVGKPTLLVPGNMSPHTFALKPSNATDINESDIVFLVDKHLETFLAPTLDQLPKSVTVVELAQTEGINLLPTIDSGLEELEEKKDEHDLDPALTDFHIWLDTKNAALMIQQISDVLSKADWPNRNKYAANADKYIQELWALDVTIRGQLEDGLKAFADDDKTVPYLVYHPAYQYFEKAYGLDEGRPVLMHPEAGAGVKSLSDLLQFLEGKKLNCVFSEPQFDSALVKQLARKLDAKVVAVNVDGSTYPPGRGVYLQIMGDLAKQVSGCYSRKRGK